MQLLIFAVAGMVAMLIAYAFGLGGAVSSLVFLTILFVGGLLRVAGPLIERLKP
ncbi:MAG TPA: hypothetical protein VEK39_06000 [Solirubrobacterales bacterium]|nr:hypothetical protein [Solirubrobacterales bacterium]